MNTHNNIHLSPLKKRPPLLKPLAIVALSILAPSWALGADQIVTTVIDETNDPATLSLREAIAAVGSGDIITFDPAVFNGDLADTIELTSELTINKALTIDASNITSGVTIDGGGNGDFLNDSGETRCFFISDNNGSTSLVVALHSLTIQNGSHEGNDAGANIHNRETLTLTNCQILNGRAFGGNETAVGGGIFSEDGTLSLTQCTVSGNQTQGSSAEGGGIYIEDGALSLTQCTVSGNQTQGVFAEGGGIHNIFGNLSLTQCTVSGNQTQGSSADGGGIHSVLGNLSLTQCTVSGNQTQGSDAEGGGIFSDTNLDAQTTQLFNCTIFGNSAPNAAGGGIHNNDGLTVIEHCTIVGNTAANGQGAGVSSFGDNRTRTEISNSIVRDNLGGFDLALFALTNNSFTVSGSNLIGTLGSDAATNTQLNTDPLLLAPLGDFGGPTQTMPPLAGSPAIDAAGTADPRETDQRGLLGLVNGNLDIGAVEFQGNDVELDLVFNEDIDRDGTSVGVELAIGTDPFVADAGNEANLRLAEFNASGQPTFTFGLDDNQQDSIILRLVRSIDLVDFTIIMSNEDSLFADPGTDLLELDDENPPAGGRAFYRLEAERRP